GSRGRRRRGTHRGPGHARSCGQGKEVLYRAGAGGILWKSRDRSPVVSRQLGISLSFSDNPQPESRPQVSIEAMVPMDAPPSHRSMNFLPVPAPPIIVKDPVWSGWDVLL